MRINVLWVVIALSVVGCATEIAPRSEALGEDLGDGLVPHAGIHVVSDLSDLAGLSEFDVPDVDLGADLGGLPGVECVPDSKFGIDCSDATDPDDAFSAKP